MAGYIESVNKMIGYDPKKVYPNKGVKAEPIDPRTGVEAPLRAGGSTSATPAPSDPNRTSTSGTSGPAPVDKSNNIALQLAGLAAADTQYSTGVSAVDKALAQLMGRYDAETKTNEDSYKTQADTNMNNLQKNKQAAMVNAAQGRRGLFGTLSSLGALSGDGITLANKAVQKGANDDLTGASENFGENQSGIDTAIGQFRQDDKFRRENANTSAENAKTNVAANVAKSRMSFYSNLANDYADMGNAAEAKRYSDLAAGLYPEMARTSLPETGLAYTGAAFTPASLQNYIAGADTTRVSTAPGQGPAAIPGLIASPVKKKQLQPA